ncbi:helix-turn-helix transcriptional regulator [Methylotuvimicrobium sp. KM2]|uniref:helix-turn-helix domain-containing protein n=1 Tax=Methylotuvimicrobium sp. KM2 TaxID=3133976 RepID=UPI0031012E9F
MTNYSERARTAGKISAIKRRAANEKRNDAIYFAYQLLHGEKLIKKDRRIAFDFLEGNNFEDIPVIQTERECLELIAVRAGVSPRMIRNILESVSEKHQHDKVDKKERAHLILFGERLKEARLASGYSAKSLATILEVTPSELGDIELGRMESIPLSFIVRACNILKVEPGYLLGTLDGPSELD